MDFRLGFGASFGEDTEIVVIDVAEPERHHPRAVAVECYGALAATLEELRAAAGGKALASERWISELRASETRAARGERAELEDRVRRCTRCGCTRSWRRCSTATRS